MRRRLFLLASASISVVSAASADEVRLPGFVPPISTSYLADVGAGEVALFRWRSPAGGESETGFAVSGGRLAWVRAGAFNVGGGTGSTLRIFGSHGAAFSFTYTTVASVRLGPVEPEVGLTLNTVTLDVVRGKVSAELFSPRVSAGVSFRLSHRVSLGASVFSEYLWRWFGDDVRMFGGVCSLRVDGDRFYGVL